MDQLKLALDTGEPHLTSEQISIVNECMTRKSFGMSIPMGQGKCAAFNTPTLMYDGSIKMVQDVKIGDLLMGDDSQPRKVLSLGRGRDIMYDVIPQKGETYTFNSKHILSLKCTNIGVKQVNNKWQATWFNNQTIKTQSKNFEYETEAKEYLKQFTDESKICDIEIKEYLKLPEYMKDMLKLYRVPVNFPCKEVPFDPYTIGLWIGDGDSNGPGFTSQDSAIIVYLKKKLPEYDMYLSHTKEYEYRIMGFNNKNRFLNVLHELNLLNNKHIPDLYMVNSRQVRLELLAGLIDTDGHLNDNSYEFTQKDEKTMDGVIYLARSLGFAAYKAVKTTSWTYKGIKQNGIAWRTTISGTINEIPVKIERKKAQPSQQPKDVLVTSFKLLEKGEDDYYGFEISGNHRYLLGNFTVTHNTIMANIVALKKLLNQEITEPILVIASKSLLASWELEITKFFGDALIYQLMNVDSRNFVLQDDTMLVLTTPETAAKFYKDNLINEKFITYEKYDDGGPFPRTKNVYDSPQFPYLKHAIGGSILYQKKWGCLIIDEAHKYTKISTRRCQALAAISAHNRYVLSGTLFDEPDIERILGYYVILHWPGIPKDLPEITKYVKLSTYRGTNETVVTRAPVKLANVQINKQVIEHNLSVEEGMIYCSMKQTLKILKDHLKHIRYENKAEKKKFSTYILAMITFLRQSIVVPILPIANIALEMSEMKTVRSDLSMILTKQFNQLNLHDFLNNPNSVKSSRIKKVLETIEKHNKPTDKIIVFSCFRTSLDVLEYFVNEEIAIDIYTLESTMSVAKRGKLIADFNQSEENSILFTTYELGAEGLNLQSANTVIILDFWWNVSKINQAIARVVRNGQNNPVVNIYFYTSDTGIEKALFQKQQDKLICLAELKTGPMKSVVKTLRMDQILKLIDKNENGNYLRNNYM